MHTQFPLKNEFRSETARFGFGVCCCWCINIYRSQHRPKSIRSPVSAVSLAINCLSPDERSLEPTVGTARPRDSSESCAKQRWKLYSAADTTKDPPSFHVAPMSKGARVGVLNDRELDPKEPFERAPILSADQQPLDNGATSLREDEQINVEAAPAAEQIDSAASLVQRRRTIGNDRLGSRKLSVSENVLVKKTSVMLSNPAAVETILTHAELKKLQIFNSKYLGKPLLKSSRSVRSSVGSNAQASFSELGSSARGSTDQPDPNSKQDSNEESEPALWLVNLRARMKKLVKTDAFRAIVYFIVLADIAVLALDDDYYNGSAYANLDIAFTLLSGLEIVLKSIAFGFYSGPESYLKRSRFRILNIIMLLASLLSHLGGTKLRVLRGIKTFRSLTMYSGLRRILRSLIRAIPFLANVGTLALFFLLAFSIFGLEAYHGVYDNQCSVTGDGIAPNSSSLATAIFEALPRVYCSGNDSCAANDQLCLTEGPPSKNINFDSGISSIFMVFLVVAQDGWVTDIMEPVLEGTSYWSVGFFVAIIASMVFLVVNLFVAVITTAFMNFTIDAESEEHQPRFMGRMDPEEEETHVSLIMGATLAIEESIQAESLELEGDGSKTSSRTSAVSGFPLLSSDLLLNGQAREAMDMISQPHQWKSVRDLTAEATKELIQNPSSLEEFMLPFAKVYQRHASSPKNTNRGSVGEGSNAESALDTRRSGATARTPALLVDIHEHTPFDSLNALVSDLNEHANSVFARYQKLVFSKRFDDFITGCIVVNTVFLLLEYPDMSGSLRLVLSVSEYMFGSIFAFEMIARIVAMKGLRAYLHSTERRFDMIVVVCTTINMVLNNVDINFSGLNSVSSLRTLRVSRLMLKYEGTRKLIESVLKSSRGVMDVVAFLVLFQIVNSIVAMQLFGGGHIQSADNTPRWNFDTFGRSFLTLLQVITGDQWSSIAFDAVDAENPHWFMVPFLVVIFIIGQYVLLNLFIAVILENFSISEEEAYQLQLAQIIAIPKELDIFEKIEENGVCVFGEMEQLDNVSNVKLRMFLGLDDNYDPTNHSNRISGVSNGRFIHKNAPNRAKAPQHRNFASTLKTRITAKWKRFCVRVATNAWFSRLVQIVIVISCANLVIDDPHPEMSQNPPSDELTRALAIMNDMILFVLFFEFVVKAGAFGFGFEYLRVSIFHNDERLGYVRKQAYMEDRWNQLDFVLLVIAIGDAVVTGMNPTMRVAGVFRAGRVLRPLRILNHYQEMKVILTAVAQSVPQVGNVFALCMLVYIIFGVVGRSIFAGKFYSCNDPAVTTAAQCIGFFSTFPDGALGVQEATARGVPSGAILVPRVWSNARFSFDHIGAAFLALLEMTSLKWVDKAFAAMDIVAENKQPVQDNSPIFAVFFVLYVYVGSLFVIRLFVGVLVEQFQRNDGTQILTESQKSWVDLEKFILLLKPLRLLPRPRLSILNKLYDLCQHPYFARAISAAILLNILLLLVNPNSTSTVSLSYKVIEMLFLGIFTIEAILKCLAFRHYYLFSANGAFEVAILVGSLIAYFSATGYHSLIQAGRIFRIMRVFRFVKLNKGVYTIFQTFRASLRPIAHIFFLMCTIIFIFAIVARQLFGGVRFGPAMNHFSNFRTFGSSVLLLFQIMSGDDWHLTMTDCMASKPFCSERIYAKTGALVTDCGNVPTATVFFATYVTLVVFVFLNLFVTVILENFRSCYLKSDVCAISLLDFEEYREVFQKYDIHGKGTFPLWQLASFLSELPPSLRIERNRQRRAFLQIRSQVQSLLSMNSQKRPYFNELLRILCIHQMGIRSLPYEQQRDRVKQIFIYRAKVAHMMVESVVKGYVYRWRQRQYRTKNLLPLSAQQTPDGGTAGLRREEIAPPVQPSAQLPAESNIPDCSPQTFDHDTKSGSPARTIRDDEEVAPVSGELVDLVGDAGKEVRAAVYGESTTVPPMELSASTFGNIAQPGSEPDSEALERDTPDEHEARSSHHRHRKHRRHKKKHRPNKAEEVEHLDTDEQSSKTNSASATELRNGFSPSDEENDADESADHIEHHQEKSTSQQVEDVSASDLVTKRENESMHEPSSLHLPMRLLRLNSPHHSSKVIPT